MHKLFNRWRPKFKQDGEYSAYRGLFQLLDRFLYSSPATTSSAPHVRDANNVQRLLNNFVIATLPCWLIGMWNLGQQTNLAMLQIGLEAAPGWRGWLLSSLNVGYDPLSIGACLLHGFLYFLPIFIVALLAGTFWESVFAQQRRRPVDEGLLSIAWLFAMILPATAPLYQVALGMTFGIWVEPEMVNPDSDLYRAHPDWILMNNE